MSVKLYEVGGHVRDSLRGVRSNDIDLAVEAGSYEEMRAFVVANTKKIFLEKPEFLTIRAQDNDGKSKDFVLCRKDGVYSDGRRPDSVEPGTIFDDLARRDFTINAMARDVITGEIIDPFNGQEHLKNEMIVCVGRVEDRFNEDALRIIRAIRFSVVLDFQVNSDIRKILFNPGSGYWPRQIENVSRDRVREELHKMFKANPGRSMEILVKDCSAHLRDVIFGKDIWLKPTTESR